MKNVYILIIFLLFNFNFQTAIANQNFKRIFFSNPQKDNTIPEVLFNEKDLKDLKETFLMEFNSFFNKDVAKRFKIITTEEINILLEQSDKVNDCIGTCLVSLGKNLGADYIIEVSLTKKKKTLITSFKLIDVRTDMPISIRKIKTDISKDVDNILEEIEKTRFDVFHDLFTLKFFDDNYDGHLKTKNEFQYWSNFNNKNFSVKNPYSTSDATLPGCPANGMGCKNSLSSDNKEIEVNSILNTNSDLEEKEREKFQKIFWYTLLGIAATTVIYIAFDEYRDSMQKDTQSLPVGSSSYFITQDDITFQNEARGLGYNK